MSYKLIISEKDIFGKGKFINAKGNAECVEFVRQATSAPNTALWKKGIHVVDAGLGEIPRGTAIATFDEKGKYPIDALGKHAAIFLWRTTDGVVVLDQWNKQGEVLERTIFIQKPDYPRQNSANQFYVIE